MGGTIRPDEMERRLQAREAEQREAEIKIRSRELANRELPQRVKEEVDRIEKERQDKINKTLYDTTLSAAQSFVEGSVTREEATTRLATAQIEKQKEIILISERQLGDDILSSAKEKLSDLDKAVRELDILNSIPPLVNSLMEAKIKKQYTNIQRKQPKPTITEMEAALSQRK